MFSIRRHSIFAYRSALFASGCTSLLVAFAGCGGVEQRYADTALTGTVTVGWSAPADHATLSGTATLAVTGTNLVNVEFFQGGTMVVRAQVADDHRSASAAFDTTQLADGPISLRAHAWNSPAGTSFTSEADAGERALVVDNGGGGGGDGGGSGGPESGLPWRSGASTDDLAAFETWRGRDLDIFETWPNRSNWTEIRNPDIYGAVSAFNGRAGTLSIGIAMLPEDKSGSFATCATGAYDQYYKDIGSKLVSLGRGDAFVRLGWEANGDWYAWSIGSDAQSYINCFRKQATALRSTAPGVRLDWNMTKDSHMTGSVADAYPGDAWVDVIGVDFYDAWPAYPTQSAWDGDYDATQNGGPRGIGSWLAFAQAHGKPLSLPEWGLSNDGGGGGGADDPLFIQNIFSFLQTNAAHIAYEAYFNLQDPGFIILPAGKNPNGSAKYKSLF